MKLNLIRDSNDVISGYVNIDPYGKSESVVIHSYENLDDIAENAQCTDIIARDVIDYIEPLNIDNVLRHWLSKLRINGKITISGTDLMSVCEKYVEGAFDADVATALIYGERTESHKYKKNASTLENVVRFLEMCGLKIILKSLNSDLTYTVQAQRIQ